MFTVCNLLYRVRKFSLVTCQRAFWPKKRNLRPLGRLVSPFLSHAHYTPEIPLESTIGYEKTPISHLDPQIPSSTRLVQYPQMPKETPVWLETDPFPNLYPRDFLIIASGLACYHAWEPKAEQWLFLADQSLSPNEFHTLSRFGDSLRRSEVLSCHIHFKNYYNHLSLACRYHRALTAFGKDGILDPQSRESQDLHFAAILSPSFLNLTHGAINRYQYNPLLEITREYTLNTPQAINDSLLCREQVNSAFQLSLSLLRDVKGLYP